MIIISDGISLRNFVYSNFYKTGKDLGYDITFLNSTPFDLSSMGINQVNIERPRLHPFNSILKNVRKHIEIKQFIKRNEDTVYNRYLFPFSQKTFKNKIKTFIAKTLIKLYNSEKGLSKIRRLINYFESRTIYYQKCNKIISEYQPDLVYNTSQRSILSIAPILAAKNNNIPTIGFIYSWDNLPKATLDVMTDYYHVWSKHMKKELLHYHNFIKSEHAIVTGTPQFETHFMEGYKDSKDVFYKDYGLDPEKEYICFSGDDVTTSPKDPFYLRDVAKAVRHLNKKGRNLGVIFRRCPVDVSNRYDEVIATYKDEIVVINPIWKTYGNMWDTIIPTIEDSKLLTNVAAHCALVINLGSSMVFDFAIHEKPCMYVNYNYFKSNTKPEEGIYTYEYVHFRSQPSKDVVVWINNPNKLAQQIESLLNNKFETVEQAKLWYHVINEPPYKIASQRILKSISDIISQNETS